MQTEHDLILEQLRAAFPATEIDSDDAFTACGMTYADGEEYAKRLSGKRWDALDRAYLAVICERFDGGPVGIDSLAASLAEDRDTLEFVYEPYLIQEGFLIRTPRGRQVTRRAYEHLGLPPPAASSPSRPQGTLF